MSFSSLLINIGDIEQRLTLQTFTGDVEITYGIKQSGVSMRIQYNKASEKNGREGEYYVAPYTIYLDATESIVETDRITSAGVVYEIIRAEKDSSGHHYELQCKVIDN